MEIPYRTKYVLVTTINRGRGSLGVAHTTQVSKQHVFAASLTVMQLGGLCARAAMLRHLPPLPPPVHAIDESPVTVTLKLSSLDHSQHHRISLQDLLAPRRQSSKLGISHLKDCIELGGG